MLLNGGKGGRRLTIKEVEIALDITRANIRFYEKEGLLIPKRNQVSGYREFSNEDLKTLKKILFLRKLDITIDDIRCVQNEKITMEKLLSEQVVILENKVKLYESAHLICNELIKHREFAYGSLNVDTYQDGVKRSDFMLLKDTISNLASLKSQITIGLLLLLSLAIAILSYPLLPDLIPIEWNESAVIRETGKAVLFLFPLAGLMIVLITKPIIWKILYINAPYYLVKADCTTSRIEICLIVVLISYQLYAVFYTNTMHIKLCMIFLIEFLLLLLFMVIPYLLKKFKQYP